MSPIACAIGDDGPNGARESSLSGQRPRRRHRSPGGVARRGLISCPSPGAPYTPAVEPDLTESVPVVPPTRRRRLLLGGTALVVAGMLVVTSLRLFGSPGTTPAIV